TCGERDASAHARCVAELDRTLLDRHAAEERIGGRQLQRARTVEDQRSLAGGADPAAVRAALVGDDVVDDGFLARRRREHEALGALQENARAERLAVVEAGTPGGTYASADAATRERAAVDGDRRTLLNEYAAAGAEAAATDILRAAAAA